jgi:hypothetical protein
MAGAEGVEPSALRFGVPGQHPTSVDERRWRVQTVDGGRRKSAGLATPLVLHSGETDIDLEGHVQSSPASKQRAGGWLELLKAHPVERIAQSLLWPSDWHSGRKAGGGNCSAARQRASGFRRRSSQVRGSAPPEHLAEECRCRACPLRTPRQPPLLGASARSTRLPANEAGRPNRQGAVRFTRPIDYRTRPVYTLWAVGIRAGYGFGTRSFQTRFEEAMFRRVVSRSFVGLLAAAALGVFAATPALAYGAENYQIGFAGTAVYPAGGFSFGFWGWCAFGGGTGSLPTSGTTGDCQFAEYIHSSSVRATCHQSIDATSWTIESSVFPGFVGIPTFHVTGTATLDPAGAAPICLTLPGVAPASFTDFDTLLPAIPGHTSLPSSFLIPGSVGELQLQVTPLP